MGKNNKNYPPSKLFLFTSLLQVAKQTGNNLLRILKSIVVLHGVNIGFIQARILDIIIRWDYTDKTLVCAFEDNFKQNGVNFYRPSKSKYGQNITNITMI